MGEILLSILGELIEEEGYQEVGLKGILEILNLDSWRVPEGLTKASCRALLGDKRMSAIEGLKDHENTEIAEVAYKILEGNL